MMRRAGAWNGLYTLFLYGLFAFFSLVLVLLGVSAYRGIVSQSDQIGQSRTAFLYIQHKLESRLDRVEGQEDTLILIDGSMITYIFEQDGMLYEAAAMQETDPHRLQKDAIARVDAFHIEHEGDLITVSFLDELGNRKVIYSTERGVRS